MKRSLLCCLAGLVCLATTVACDGPDSEPVPPSVTSTPESPSVSRGSPTAEANGARCPNQTAAVEMGEVVGGTVAGDLGGDGSPDDETFLVTDESGGPGCRHFLVAEVGDERLVAPTTEEGLQYDLQLPRIHAIVQVDGEGAEEILVDLEQGASTQFIGMFTVAGGGLERVVVQENTDFGNLFPYGGSVGHLEASNCTDRAGADVVVAVAMANTTDYTVRYRLYDMVGSRLEALPRRQQPPIETVNNPTRLDEFASSPFGECPQSGGGET